MFLGHEDDMLAASMGFHEPGFAIKVNVFVSKLSK